MIPTTFKDQNCTYAENQPEYIPLPAHRTKDGEVTSCWKFSFWERVRILFGAPVYWTQMTFNQALQPVRPSLDFASPIEGKIEKVEERQEERLCSILTESVAFLRGKTGEDLGDQIEIVMQNFREYRWEIVVPMLSGVPNEGTVR